MYLTCNGVQIGVLTVHSANIASFWGDNQSLLMCRLVQAGSSVLAYEHAGLLVGQAPLGSAMSKAAHARRNEAGAASFHRCQLSTLHHKALCQNCKLGLW